MTVVQISPCVLTADWSGFVAWCATTFDMPVACQYDDQGWARLLAPSQGITVIDQRHFSESSGGDTVVVELQVQGIQRYYDRALTAGAMVVRPPTEVSSGIHHAALLTPQGVRLWLLSDDASRQGDAPSTVALNDGPIHFTVDRVIDASAEDVFRAATAKDTLEKFFVHHVSGDMTGLGTVSWEFEGMPPSPLDVVAFRPNAYVAFHWPAHRRSYLTRTQFVVTAVGPTKARLAITESGWDGDTAGLRSAFDHCEGWTQFLGNMKVFLEHGISHVEKPSEPR